MSLVNFSLIDWRFSDRAARLVSVGTLSREKHALFIDAFHAFPPRYFRLKALWRNRELCAAKDGAGAFLRFMEDESWLFEADELASAQSIRRALNRVSPLAQADCNSGRGRPAKWHIRAVILRCADVYERLMGGRATVSKNAATDGQFPAFVRAVLRDIDPDETSPPTGTIERVLKDRKSGIPNKEL